MTERIGTLSHAPGRPPASISKTVTHVMTTGGTTATLAAAPRCAVLAAVEQQGSLPGLTDRSQIDQQNIAADLVNVRVISVQPSVYSHPRRETDRPSASSIKHQPSCRSPIIPMRGRGYCSNTPAAQTTLSALALPTP
jgi:hypothetical protein